MNNVRICYYLIFFSFLPKWAQFKYKKVLERLVPKEWNDLSGEQLTQIVKVLHTLTDSNAIKLNLLKILLCLRWYTVLSFTSVQVINISWLTDFIFKDLTLTKNLIPVVSIRKKWYKKKVVFHGPGDRLRNITFGEFVVADTLFMHYSKNQDMDPKSGHGLRSAMLDRLIATLYRPQAAGYNPDATDYNGDIREKFNDELIEKRVAYIEQLRPEVKQAILLFYQGCRKQLALLYPEVFSSGEENKAVQHPWLQMAGNIPNEKFGTIPEILTQRLHQVLFHLNQMIIENKERIKELENQRNNQ